MIQYFRTHPLALVPLGVIVAGLAYLAFGFFGVQYLFIDDVVDEAAPVFDQPAASTAAPTSAASTDAAPPVSPETASDVGAGSPEEGSVPPGMIGPDVTMDDDMPEMEDETPQVVTEYEGSFESDAHPTSGRAIVLGNGTGQRFLRFEDFETDNGPDLNVYLVSSAAENVTDDFVDLGDLAGNIGSQNYEIPAGLDLDVYDRVVIWCVRFGVGFGDADLTSV